MRSSITTHFGLLLLTGIFAGCTGIPITEVDGDPAGDLRPHFATAYDTIPYVLEEITATATYDPPNWSAFRSWLADQWLSHNTYAPTATEFYDAFPGGGGSGAQASPNGTPAPAQPKPSVVPIKIDSIGAMCPDLPSRNVLCIDAWISQEGILIFGDGDGREITPFADSSMSRVQLIIDLANPAASYATVSQTCILGHVYCRDPLGAGANGFTVQYNEGVYSVNYSFRNSLVPSLFGAAPSIAGNFEVSLDEYGWAQLQGGWNHSAFPSVAMWHFKYGHYNRKLIVSDTDVSFRDFVLHKFETTYTTVPIN